MTVDSSFTAPFCRRNSHRSSLILFLTFSLCFSDSDVTHSQPVLIVDPLNFNLRSLTTVRSSSAGDKKRISCSSITFHLILLLIYSYVPISCIFIIFRPFIRCYYRSYLDFYIKCTTTILSAKSLLVDLLLLVIQIDSTNHSTTYLQRHAK